MTLPVEIREPVERICSMTEDELAVTVRDLDAMACHATSERQRGFAELLLDVAHARREGGDAFAVAETRYDLLLKLRNARLRAESRHSERRPRTVFFETASGRLRRR